MTIRFLPTHVIRPLALAATAILASAAPVSVALAHTDTDVVAVPAGAEAAVTFRPQHGCGDSPTIAVAVRAPVADAVAEDVEGWTASSTPDGEGRTVLEWTGGVLPTDEAGAFPVEFLAPDTVGTLLTFPAVQTCENGEELAWISGNPADEYPAPRLLILAPGSEPAATVDDVPLDAPGRDQLTAIVDVDNPGSTTLAPAPTEPDATDPVVTQPADTEAAVTEPAVTELAAPVSVPDTAVATDPGDTTLELGTSATASEDDGSTPTVWIVLGVIAFVAIAGGVILAARRRGGTPSPSDQA